jgi:hypothetical protein
VGHIARIGEMRNRQPERKGPLGKPRRIWEDNIRVDLRETDWEYVDFIYLVQGKHQWRTVMNTVTNLRVP